MAHIAFVCPYDQHALGPRTLSAILKQRGHTTSLVILKTTLHNRNPDNLVVPDGYRAEETCCSEKEYGLVRDILKERTPDMIGISYASTMSGISEWLTGRFHEDFPGVPVVHGGSDPTLNPELCVKSADYVFVGETERTFPEFVERLLAGKDVTDIPGLWTERDGATVRNPPASLIENLDEIPFADFDMEGKFLVEDDAAGPTPYPYFILMSQRGCPCHCTYCMNSLVREFFPGQRHLRRRTVGHVIEEIKAARRMYPGLDLVEFYDDIFTINKKWLREFAERYPREVGIPFWGYTYPGMCDAETADLLRKAGIAFAHMGIQSGSERTLKEVFKRPPLARPAETAKILLDRGIVCWHDLIAANPFETDEDHLETLETLLELPHPCRIDLINPLTFFYKMPITKMAAEREIPLRDVEGSRVYYPVDSNHYRFWRQVFWLTQFPRIPDKFLRRVARSDYHREHPEDLETLVEVMEGTVWHNSQLVVTREARIEELEGRLAGAVRELQAARERLGRIEGSRLYKLYRKLKPLWSGGKR